MCSLGSSSTAGVGTDKRLAIGEGSVLGGVAAGGGPAGVRQTILGGSQRTGAGGSSNTGAGSTRGPLKPNLNR